MGKINSWRISPGSPGCPLIIAHRGASGLAPENTLAAFHKALEVGADAIELDVRLTRDGRVVVIHDRMLNRTTTGKGPVGTYSLEEVKSLDAGSWFGPQFSGERVPTLEEVFDVMPPEFPVYVELKARGHGGLPLALRVLNIIRRYERWESTLVASFNPMAMALLRAAGPRIIRGYIWSRHHPLPMRARWFSPLVKPHWFAPDRGSITPALLARFHSQGNPVAAWDVDARTNMHDLTKMGLDAVVTNHPEYFVSQKFAANLKDQVAVVDSGRTDPPGD